MAVSIPKQSIGKLSANSASRQKKDTRAGGGERRGSRKKATLLLDHVLSDPVAVIFSESFCLSELSVTEYSSKNLKIQYFLHEIARCRDFFCENIALGLGRLL